MTVAAGIGEVGVTWQESIDAVARQAALPVASVAESPVPVVPSSLGAPCEELSRLRASLRDAKVRTTQVLPRSLASIGIGRRAGTAWQGVEVEGRRFRVDARLSRPYVALVLVDPARKSGPFVLDLPSRFLHPVDRARLAIMPDRLRLMADIAAPVSPALGVILSPIAGGWLSIVTRDVIAAELWALAVAERFHEREVEMQVPWEDPTVQRATELELGLRVPQELHVRRNDTNVWPPAARELLQMSATRLGVRLSEP